ncbi:hypothetical protein D7316_03395 [Gordonia insulae]|uniref:DUF3263 domain-containing protein n=1 Tax=Gordonia insulae TaxID=2420509 RepID=A0A3G8JRI2_9ACTN|nr:hypothetical protein D7316_03395 [Gordonia insulae]
MVAFAQRWYRYGGGDPSDIMIEFGLSERDYFLRLRDALGDHQGLDPQTAADIAAVVARRLDELGPRTDGESLSRAASA